MKYYKLDSKTLYQDIIAIHKEAGGVYKLVCLKQDEVVQLARVLSVDDEGVLYIGKANSFVDRVINLKKTLLPNYQSESHICGRRYNANTRMKEIFPVESLYVCLEQSEDSATLESQLLESYFQKFGEVPPLNAIG
jgi:hypothetical protein